MTSTEVSVHGGGALALRADQVEWSSTQRAALAQIGIGDAPPGDQVVFLHVCQKTGLDPFARQIYMICRNDKDAPGGKKWTIQTGIDGFRLVSERHSQYGGALDAEWCGRDGMWRDVWTADTPPVAARFTVIRKDWPHPVRAVAHFGEFAQRKYNGELMVRWATAPAHMLSKCAESLARRRAFPQDLASVFTDDEMGHVDNPPQVVINGDMGASPEPGPDWDALIRDAEDSGDREEILKVWNLAKGLLPNDGELRERIALAGERVTAAAAAETGTPTDGPVVDVSHLPESNPAPGLITERQSNRMHAKLTEGGVKRDTKLAYLTFLTGREITTSAELTETEADAAIRSLAEIARGDTPMLEVLIELIDRPEAS